MLSNLSSLRFQLLAFFVILSASGCQTVPGKVEPEPELAQYDLAQYYTPPGPTDFFVSNTPKNPVVDTSGNTWTLYQIIDDSTANPQVTSGNYSPMVYSSPNPFWIGTAADSGPHPAYRNSTKDLTSTGAWSGHPRIGALSFKPYASKLYSFTGSLTCIDWSVNGLPTQLLFGKLSHGQWIGLYNASVPSGGTLDLSTIPNLRDIAVKSDEELLALVESPYWGSNVARFAGGANPVAIKITGDINSVPAFRGSDGNPYVQSLSGKWTTQYITETASGFETNFENYHPMIWSSPDWVGASVKWGHPIFDPSSMVLTSAGGGDNGSGLAQRKSAITFAPYQSGQYRLTGILKCYDWSISGNATILKFGVFSKGNPTTWTQLYQTTVATGGEINLGVIGALFGISLNAGDVLSIIVASPFWSSGAAYFADTASNPVSIDKMPDTYAVSVAAPPSVNPSYDYGLNKWQVFQVTSGNPSDVSSFSAMTWDATNNYWIGPSSSTTSHPRWYPHGSSLGAVLSAGRMSSGAQGIPVLKFTPANAGQYSWTGRLNLGYWSFTSAGAVVFGKVTSTNTFVTLYTHNFTTTSGLAVDLEMISALQGITLNTGDSLTVCLNPGFASANGAFFKDVAIKVGNRGNLSSMRPANPATDEAGNNWSFYQILSGDQTNFSTYRAMTWDSTDVGWKGPSLRGGGHPYLHQNQQRMHVLSAGRGSTTSDEIIGGIPTVKFTPAAAGNYSWQGTLSLAYWSFTSNGNVKFGKFNSTNSTYTLLYDHSFTTASGLTIDLSAVMVLQNVTLGTGESLTISLHPGYATANGMNLDGVNILHSGYASKIPSPLVSTEIPSMNITHIIDTQAAGTPIERRNIGLTAGFQETDTLFVSGMLVRGPGLTSEDTNWKAVQTNTSGHRSIRTALEFVQLAGAQNIIPLFGVVATGRNGFDGSGNSMSYRDYALSYDSKGQPLNGITYPLSTDQVTALAKHAADCVRYTNYILQHYKQGDVIAGRDADILESLHWTDENNNPLPKLPGPTDPTPPKVTYWEIGNEPDHALATAGKGYADAYKAISQAMLAEDSSIKIGPALGSSQYWGDTAANPNVFNIFDSVSGSQVNFVSVHPYDLLKFDYKVFFDKLYNSGENSFLYPGDAAAWKKILEKDLRGLNSPSGWAYRVRDTLIQKLNADYPSFSTGSLEVFAGEYDPMDWVAWSTSDPDWPYANGYYPQYSMYSSLGLLETLFIFQNRGYNGACLWDFEGSESVVRPCQPLFEKLGQDLGNSLQYQYAPVASLVDDRADSVRIYATKTTSNGKIAVWLSNMWHDRPATVRLGVRGLSAVPTVTELVLRNPNDDLNHPGFLNHSFSTANPPPVPPPQSNIIWTAVPFAQAGNISDFTLMLPPATITLLEITP